MASRTGLEALPVRCDGLSPHAAHQEAKELSGVLAVAEQRPRRRPLHASRASSGTPRQVNENDTLLCPPVGSAQWQLHRCNVHRRHGADIPLLTRTRPHSNARRTPRFQRRSPLARKVLPQRLPCVQWWPPSSACASERGRAQPQIRDSHHHVRGVPPNRRGPKTRPAYADVELPTHSSAGQGRPTTRHPHEHGPIMLSREARAVVQTRPRTGTWLVQ
mmetsp:Transcript_12510/g.34566  ORF Transcript_12510/g.34566 Transcript_12510/m.34566 type:complete len:218 (-) Transcript_12510:943-1596(-)